MVLIRIEKPKSKMRTPLDVTYFGIAVEKVLHEYAHCVSGPHTQKGSFRDLQKGVLGADTSIYHSDSGIIEYKLFITTSGYFAHIELKDFPEDDKKFKEIKGKLEEIAKIEDGEVLRQRLNTELESSKS